MLDPRGWQKLTDLKTLGVRFTRGKATPDVSQSRASGDAVEIKALADLDAGATVGVKLTGGMEVSFKRGGAFLVRIENCRHQGISDLLAVHSSLKELVTRKELEWSSRWVLVTEVTTAEPAIVLIAKNAAASARIEIHSNADVGNLANLATANGELRLTSESAIEQRVVSLHRRPPARCRASSNHGVKSRIRANADVEQETRFRRTGRGRPRVS